MNAKDYAYTAPEYPQAIPDPPAWVVITVAALFTAVMTAAFILAGEL